MKNKQLDSFFVLRRFILETLELYESSTSTTAGTSATSPTASGTKVSKELETKETPEQEKDERQKNSFVGKSLEKAKDLAKKPPMGSEVKKVVSGPGQPKDKIANAGKMFGSLIAQELPDIEKLNAKQVSQEFKRKAGELEDEITMLQQARAQMSDLEKNDKPKNPLISNKK